MAACAKRNKLRRHPEEPRSRAASRRIATSAYGHRSRLAREGEHLRMTAVAVATCRGPLPGMQMADNRFRCCAFAWRVEWYLQPSHQGARRDACLAAQFQQKPRRRHV